MSLAPSTSGAGAVLADYGEEADALATRSWQSLAEEVLILRAQRDLLQESAQQDVSQDQNGTNCDQNQAEEDKDVEVDELAHIEPNGGCFQNDLQKAAVIWNTLHYTTKVLEAISEGRGDNFTWRHFLVNHCGVQQVDAEAYERKLIRERIGPELLFDIASDPEMGTKLLALCGFAMGDCARVVKSVSEAIAEVIQSEPQLSVVPALNCREGRNSCDFEGFVLGLNELRDMVSPAQMAFSGRFWKAQMSKALPPVLNLLMQFGYTSLDYLRGAPTIPPEAVEQDMQRRTESMIDAINQDDPRRNSRATPENERTRQGHPVSDVSVVSSRVSHVSAPVVSVAEPQGVMKLLSMCCRFCNPDVRGSSHHCFVEGSLLKGLDNTFIPVEQLQQHYHIRGADGHPISIKNIKVHQQREQTLVEVQTENASLTVTDTHRMVVPRGLEQRTRVAGALKLGEAIVCSGVARTITSLRHWKQVVNVVEIAFVPDKAVECFHVPEEQILSMGVAAPSPTRRGGMWRRFRHQGTLNENLSIPNTLDSFQ